jgi:hypothetical protein
MILASLRLQNIAKRERKKRISDGEGEKERYEEMTRKNGRETRRRLDKEARNWASLHSWLPLGGGG